MTDDKLPRPHASERGGGAVERLRWYLSMLDGAMAVSTATVPDEAADIGDADVPANPRAKDLGYVDGAYCTMEHHDGTHSLFDGPHSALAGDRVMRADDGSFIEDLSSWA
jgi:hypothetical protein